ncbi:EAL domain-containing protein [Engelhardtia mirabilis]|uniref:Blue light-and temperature-regulated antirepressor YcgF n=1 Tax=Engelhardtia mirabilis TaxID=2528011 RepID=A0A518BR06_9BACT|nr:Blue light- and temperature-regulated antirepressor YcgF [Planctomycetes bacterium Pla133]QDV03743.1 Blue light- and temperature-regulated antirepressor YcgF [Planctomycetes bacterium Pla86]
MTLPSISVAFQPIVDIEERRIASYEALVRGPAGEPAAWVFDQISAEDVHRLDDACRDVAIEWAARLGIECQLNLNCLPRNLVSVPSAVEQSLARAEALGLLTSQLVLEVTEGEVIEDQVSFAEAIGRFRKRGISIAIDDFGSGYSGLNLLADFQPDTIKLDQNLLRGIEGRGPRQAIVRAVLSACLDLGIDVIAEGVETLEEFRWCQAAGITQFQGYLLGRPGFECLPEVHYPPSLVRGDSSRRRTG